MRRLADIRRPPGLALLCLLLTTVPANAADTAWVGDAHAAARLITAVQATGSGPELDAGLQIRLAPGWHTYWRTPGIGGLPPTISWTGSKNVASATVAWPAPRRLLLDGLETAGYENGVVLPVGVRLAHPGEPALLHARVDYAACKDICVPFHASLTLAIPSGLAVPGPEAALIAAARARVPGNLSSARLRVLGTVVSGSNPAILAVRLASDEALHTTPDLFIEGLPAGSAGRPQVTFASGRRIATLRVPIEEAKAVAIAGTPLTLTFTDGKRSAATEAIPALGVLAPLASPRLPIAIIGLALLGGLVLNLMPCVLPVLSLKLLALLSHAGAERRQARRGVLATAAGLMASFTALAGMLIVLREAGAAVGWGIQFQQPWFLAAMALLTTLFAASLWDWLPILLPGSIASAVNAVRGTGRLTDAFLLGAFATLLAASCSAPFVGTAVGFALARGPLDILLVFAALGLGMAIPFLAVAAWPALVVWLPRPGRWMDWLRRLLGLALLGTAAWLLSVLAAEASLRSALAASAALLVLLAVLAWRHVTRPDRQRRWVAGTAVAVLSLAAVAAPVLRGQAVPAVSPNESGPWRPYDARAVPRLVGHGRVVLVDVSAAWCLICKANELAVLDRAPVADHLRASHAVVMRADWTRPDPAITAYLQSFDRYGVPLDVVYGPGAPRGIALPALLTEDSVIDALKRAASTRNPQREPRE